MDRLEEYILKGGEASGTHAMPYSVAPAIKGTKANPVKSITKTGTVNPYIDVDDLVVDAEPSYEPSQYALPSQGKYPLDSYASVKQACAYFDEYGSQFEPLQRREFCSNLVKRASVLGITYSDRIAKYGASTFAPIVEFEAAMLAREGMVSDELKSVFTQVKEASAVKTPEDFALLLSEFDKVAGIDEYYGGGVLDPFYTTFGVR